MQISISPDEALIVNHALCDYMQSHIKVMEIIRNKIRAQKLSEDQDDLFFECTEDLKEIHEVTDKFNALLQQHINESSNN